MFSHSEYVQLHKLILKFCNIWAITNYIILHFVDFVVQELDENDCR